MQRRLSACLLAAALLIAGPMGLVRAAVPNDSSALRDAVTVDGMLEHLEALDAIGAANGNTRVDDTPGYEESVEYVADRLTDAGYDVDDPAVHVRRVHQRGHRARADQPGSARLRRGLHSRTSA